MNNINTINNTAFGYNTLQNTLISGSDNTAIGTFTLQSNISGDNNTAVGSNSLQSNTTASNNTAVGFFSMKSNTTGLNNTAVGSNSLQSNTTGQNNIAVGYQSLFNNSVGNSNTAIGEDSLKSNTTGSSNIAIGNRSLESNTTGNFNFGIGGLFSNTTGSSNIGIYGGNSITDGDLNVCIGPAAGDGIVNGDYNIAIGAFALYGDSNNPNINGSNNIAIGTYSGIAYTGNEYNNICIGATGIQGETGSIRIGGSNTHTSFYTHIKSIYDPSGNNLLTGYNQVYYNTSTNEVIRYPSRPFITITGTDAQILSAWNTQVKTSPLIHTTLVTFSNSYSDISSNPLLLPIEPFVTFGDKLTLINNSVSYVSVQTTDPNKINTEKTGSGTDGSPDKYLFININGMAELTYIGGNWAAYGVNLT